MEEEHEEQTGAGGETKKRFFFIFSFSLSFFFFLSFSFSLSSYLRRDHERRRLETKGALAFVSDDEDEDAPAKPAAPHRAGYNQEQQELRQQLLRSLHGAAEGAEDDTGGLVLRQKSAAERQAEDDDFMDWMRGEGRALLATDEKADLQPLQRFWTDSNLSESDRFLRDYITNRRWRAQVSNDVPSYDDIVREEEDEDVCPGFANQ